jgi:ABC-type lipoprotein release transport system permease subunit
VAIVSESRARQSFGAEDPIGHRLMCGFDSAKWIIATMLFGITPLDVPAYAGVLLVALPLVLAAAAIPAIRAARVDPMIALRDP